MDRELQRWARFVINLALVGAIGLVIGLHPLAIVFGSAFGAITPDILNYIRGGSHAERE